MSGSLLASVDDSQKVIRVDGLTPPLSGSQLLIDDELVTFRSVQREPTPPYRKKADGSWNVVRGVLGTTAASHAEGADVALYVPVFGPDAVEDAASGETDLTPLTWDGSALRQPLEGAGLTLEAASSAAGDGQAAQLVGGASAGTGASYIQAAGASATGRGADIYSETGTAATGSDQNGGDWYIQLSPGDGVGRTGRMYIYGLPTSDPGDAGALYTDGTPSAGVPKALMVSGGPTP